MAVPTTESTPAVSPASKARTTSDTLPVVKRLNVVTTPEVEYHPGFFSRNRTTILFGLLLVLGDFGIGLFAPLWDRHSPDDYTARVNGCAERSRDIVFIGGSPVAEGIDPARFAGVKWHGQPLADAYAIGLYGGTTTDFYYATKRACPTPPRVLVYGITATDLNDGRNEPHGTRDLLRPADVIELARTRPEVGEWTARHYLEEKFNKVANIYRYRHGIRMWSATQAEALFPGSCPEAVREANELREHAEELARGFGYAPLKLYTRFRYDQFKAAGVSPPPFNYLDHFRTGSHSKYLDKLADWCAERNVALVLVDMPVTADLEAKYPAEFGEYRERLADVERRRGLKVIRDSRVGAGLLDEHFADLIHLRQEGCLRFNVWLRAKLEEMGR